MVEYLTLPNSLRAQMIKLIHKLLPTFFYNNIGGELCYICQGGVVVRVTKSHLELEKKKEQVDGHWK